MAALDLKDLVGKYSRGSTSLFEPGQTIYSQGQRADNLFILLEGQVQLSVLSEDGKEGIIAVLPPESVFGEGCLAGQPLRISTATTMTKSAIARIEKATALQALHDDSKFAEYLVEQLLNENMIFRERLIDHFFNTSEKRLARILLTLASYNIGETQFLLPNVDQNTLAKMVGTTRGRVSHFMNKFRDLGMIDYDGTIRINSSLLNVILTDRPRDSANPKD